jgi:hypothetical protein
MDGIESFHCPICKCKTTVDFTSYLDAHAQRIAELEKESATIKVKLEQADANRCPECGSYRANYHAHDCRLNDDKVRIATLEAAALRLVEVLEKVKQFIENGVELGYIAPLKSAPECHLPGQIRAALADPILVNLRRE